MAELGGLDGSGALGINLNNGGGGMDVGRVMDYLESRLETIADDSDDGETPVAGASSGHGGRDEEEARRKGKVPERAAPIRRTSPRLAREMPPPAPLRTAPSQQPSSSSAAQQQHLHVPRSSRTFSSSPPQAHPADRTPSTRSRTKADKQLRNSTQGSSFTFNAPLPPNGVNPFERDFGSHHLLPIDHTDGPECSRIMPELPPQSLKRRHSNIVSEITSSSGTTGNGGLHASGGPSSASGRNGGQGSGSARKRNRGSGVARVSVESPEAMDLDENGEPARKKLARR